MTFNELKTKLRQPDLKETDWHQHSNGGGWVDNQATVEATAFIGPDAFVWALYGKPQVSDDAQVFGDAQVSGDARVSGDAWEKSPLFIIGTSYALTNCKRGYVRVGCECRKFDEWINADGTLTVEAAALAARHSFTPEQVLEYEAYFQLFKKIGK